MKFHIPLVGAFVALDQTAFDASSNSTQFSWVLTPPLRTLNYYDCYGGFQCARLQVPLDWSNPNLKTNTTVAVAIIKLPATVSEDDATFGGSVLISPGGPGDSGTDLLLRSGSRFQSLLAGERNYEIIGFDPRGVNLSIPHGDCYKGDEISRKLDQERNTGLSPITEDFNALNYHYASALGKSEFCEVDGVGSIWGYLNTASVARDVIEIIDRIDDLRWQNRNSTKPANAPKPRLQYIGISYGFFLGNTLASMFPERVGRIMVDGIVNAEDYTNVTWQKNLNDAEAVLDYFYQVCFDSGEGCPIRLSSDKEAADIKIRIEAFLNTLDLRPIPVAHGGKVDLITSPTVRLLILTLIYQPVKFELLALGLGALITGEYISFLEMLSADAPDTTCGGSASHNEAPPYTWYEDVAYGVVCSDAVDGVAYRNLSVSDELVHIIDRQAPTTGVVWGGRVIACAGRKIRPPYAFTGPFDTVLAYNDLDDVPSELGMPQFHDGLSKNTTIPSVSGGILWEDSVNKRLFLYGGEYFEDPPAAFVLYSYDILYNNWASLGSPTGAGNANAGSYGAGVSISSRGEAYSYGGWQSNASVPGWTGPPKALSRLIKYDMDTNSWNSIAGPDNVGRAEGVMVFIPIGDAGMLVYFGGSQDLDGNGTLTPQPMDEIFLYDVANTKWYTQKTSGRTPEIRRRFCGGATWAQDQSSYNIYIFGGAGFPPDTTGYDDIYILTIPSFQWIRGPYPANSNVTGESPKSMMSCNVVDNSQMIVIGGSYSNDTTDKCDADNVWGTHNMNLGQDNDENAIWLRYLPRLTTYAVPTDIVTAVGGRERGRGAD
uniref:Cell wall anchored protein n=1 Tax=Colletotrichum fructicola (strain Nara gc5) TaxID=1213859 RepID=L2G7B2_COLFN